MEVISLVARFVLAAGALALAGPALAYSTGITTTSGKQSVTCNACHTGGLEAVVRFEGPAAVAAGTAAVFRFSVRSQAASQALAGLDIAASAGDLDVAPDQGARAVPASEVDPTREITHAYPRAVDLDYQVSWEFTWTAPATPGTAILYGAGNTVNGDGNTTGDRGDAITWRITVFDPNATATPAPPPTRTPTSGPCPGDCRHDGTVTVDELVLATQVLLHRVPAGACDALDRGGDGLLMIDDLVAAVESAVAGCR
jgi:hypothetical protein